MKLLVIAGLLLPIVLCDSIPAEAEALFDQAHVKSFSAGAPGLNKSAFGPSRESVELRAEYEDNLVFMVPGRHPWPVLSPGPAQWVEQSQVGTTGMAVPTSSPANAKAPLKDGSGPRIW